MYYCVIHISCCANTDYPFVIVLHVSFVIVIFRLFLYLEYLPTYTLSSLVHQ